LSERGVKTKISSSKSYDPYYNLAMEEHMLGNVGENEVILYLWQNDNTIVLGRNQNPWKECRCKEFEAAGGRIARRLSGGGAVYHDMGNLNYTFISRKQLYDFDKQLHIVLEAVRKQGIDAKFSGRNDLIAEDRKFSGNAYYFSGEFAYHHGTIMVEVDFQKLTGYLQVSGEKIASKGISSVSSRVINLKDINESITIEKVSDTLRETFIEKYGGKLTEGIKYTDTEEIGSLYEKYSSWNWIYGETPEFGITFEKRFPWGGVEVNLSLKDGRIEKTYVFSDAINANLIIDIKKRLIGAVYAKDSIRSSLNGLAADTDGDRNVADDISAWLVEIMV